MNRLMLVAIALVAGLAGGAITQFLIPQQTAAPDQDAIRAIVQQAVDARIPAHQSQPDQQVAQIDQQTINPMIENYLMSDPKILQRVSDALQDQLRQEDMQQAKVGLATWHDDLYDDPDHVVLGNPDGDVTLVEFFDYNCTYCRAAMPDVAKLLDDDPDLRVILKEFPILSAESVDAARIAIAVAETPDADYRAFHQELFTSRGQVTGQTAMDAAKDIGLNPVSIEFASQKDNVSQVIQKSYDMAKGLNITGTPTFIIGDEILPGAVGYDALKQRIDNMRACGSTVCDG